MNSEVSMWPVISRCILWKSDSDRILIFNVYSERNEASLGPETVKNMMTSLNGNIFRVTGHLCGEFTDDRWIPRTKASDAELWCFLWSAPE